MSSPTYPAFSLETTTSFSLSSSVAPIDVYRHTGSELRIVFVHIPGPLTNAVVVVPTLVADNAGLPHTLEHLIFCGSRNYPNRGYLDNLALRSLSTGTNAYTAEDHTGYTFNAAGQEGLCEVLPVLLDHVLHPTLTDDQFVTEVYHIDGQGKQQGVVYSEMASCENSEADLLAHALCRQLYSGKTTYSYNCGGYTPDIARLTNADIRRYHRQFYHLDNLTVILTGDRLDAEKILARLTREPRLLVRDPVSVEGDEGPTAIQWPAVLVPSSAGAPVTETVRFPSADDEIGSVGYGWRGPPAEDVEAIVALDVLFRYLHETAASPFYQRFVERRCPLSNQVDFEIKGFVETCLVLVFSGVPVRKGSGKGERNGKEGEEGEDAEVGEAENGESEDEDGSQDDDEDDASGDEEGEDNKMDDEDGEDAENETRDLFTPGYFHSLVISVICDLVKNGFPKATDMPQTISRHRTKILEGLEDDPHDIVTAYLVPDVVANHFSPRSRWRRNGGGGEFIIGTRARIFEVLDDLATKPPQYWMELARKWLLDAPVVEVLMVPSVELGKELEVKSQAEQRARIEALGTEELAKLGEAVTKAVEANRVNLPPEVLAQMPGIPGIENIPRLPAMMRLHRLENGNEEQRRPFEVVQVVETATYFTHLKICLPASGLSEELRPFLTLFQELLYQCPLVIPRRADKRWEMETIDYQEVVTRISHELVSYESAVGFGNDTFACSWLSELFCLAAESEPRNFVILCRWLVHVLLFTEFTVDRVRTVAKNLVSSCAEVKRNGIECMSTTATRVTTALRGFELDTVYKPADPVEAKVQTTEVGGLPTLGSSKAVLGNDVAISIFRQEPFLKRIIAEIRAGRADAIVRNLENIRQHFLATLADMTARADDDDALVSGFVQLAMPTGFVVPGEILDPVEAFVDVWDKGYALYSDYAAYKDGKVDTNANKRKRKTPTIEPPAKPNGVAPSTPFPFPRTPYTPLMTRPQNLLVQLPSITASYLLAIVPCDIVFDPTYDDRLSHVDHFATLLMCELLSRSEGPLYSAIRGNGYAYDASIAVYIWTGQMTFEVREAADPGKAVRAFVDVLERTGREWEGVCGRFDVETAKAGMVYRSCAERGTAGGVIGGALRACLKGFKSLEAQDEYSRYLHKVTDADLRRVFDRYLGQFLHSESLTTILITPPEPSPDLFKDLGAIGAGPLGAAFRKTTLDELGIGVTNDFQD